MKGIPDKLYFKIGEVSDIVGVKPYVLRYWEKEFNFIEPLKARSKHRLYRKKDIETILQIKKLLYDEKLTIAGAKKRLSELMGEKKNIRESGELDLKKIVAELNEIKEFLSQ